MKGFIVIFSIITLAIAAPQYNYDKPNYIGGDLYDIPSPSYHDDTPLNTIITKQFFIHSAPEEPEERGVDKIINLGAARKQYRIVFIKAPHQNVQSGRVHVIAPSHEEKTVIYVLSKKTEAADIKADVQETHKESTKPDVFFIKYKTHEEAAHAQRQIQAQYDSLGGITEISDEGIAPLTSVVGSLGHVSSGNAGYLPPSH